MQTIAIASQKGGSGKSTLTRNIAVALGEGTVIIDTDPQGSLTSWRNRREAETPYLIGIDGTLGRTLDRLREAGVETVLIDTPPSAHAIVADVIRAADLVLVPVRPSPDDIDAVGATLEIVEGAGTPFIFVISAAKPRTRLTAETLPALAQHGRVAPVVIHDRVEFPTMALDGKAVVEGGKETAAALEIFRLVEYLRNQAAKQPRK
jgi:chromosome partitioning protein